MDRDYAGEIARASLAIGGIKLNAAQPFKWASGFYMPIYNDNRMLLGDFAHRMLVTDALVALISEAQAKPDFILGTMMAGVAPAASVAQRLQLPLVFVQDGVAYESHPDKTWSFIWNCPPERYDAIAATGPFSIPGGVHEANRGHLPFMYVRPKQKDHGLKKVVEGNPQHGQRAVLIDYHPANESYVEEAKQNLKDAGVSIIVVASNTLHPQQRDLHIADLEGKIGYAVEDLVSTGGSSAEDVLKAIKLGARMPHLGSIFNYGLEKADAAFATLPTPFEARSALTYDKLLTVAVEAGYIKPDALGILREWRQDPFGWGAKHGFPPEPKKK